MRVFVLTLLLSLPVAVGAQSVADRQAAGNAYDRGVAALASEDYAGAARWFEMANNLVPAAPALQQAISAQRNAGNERRAATLSLRLIAQFPDATDAVTFASELVAELGPNYFYVEVLCEECGVELNGTLQSHFELFLEPGEEHTVGGVFDTGAVTETVQGAAGERRTVQLDAPPAPPEPETQQVTGGGGAGFVTADPQVPRDESSGAPPALFITSLVLTLGAGGVLLWSALDTQSAADEYEMVAARERAAGAGFPEATLLLEDGRSKETRTNILIGVAGGLALLTTILLIVTDWGGEDDEAQATLRPSLALGPRGGGLSLEGSF